jgi:hypothetical protein
MAAFAYGIGKRRNRLAADPHWCPLWPSYAESAARELGFEFIRTDGGLRFRTAEQRDLVVERAEALWRRD